MKALTFSLKARLALGVGQDGEGPQVGIRDPALYNLGCTVVPKVLGMLGSLVTYQHHTSVT